MISEQTYEFIRSHRTEDVNTLLLHASRFPVINMRQAAEQIRGWQMAARKLPLWADTDGILFPPHLSMEQCSSQQTAAFKGRVVRELTEGLKHPLIADLTGGFGVDATMMARAVPHACLLFVERNEELCRLAEHNFPLLGVGRFEVVNADCETMLASLPRQHLIFIDPVRRDAHGRKTFAIEDCTPDVVLLRDRLLEKADYVLVKLSPMLDISEAVRHLGAVERVMVVGTGGECKEILLLLGSAPKDDVPVSCIELSDDGETSLTFSAEEETEADCAFTATLQTYLYEPSPAVMKAGAFRTVAARFGLTKLHPNSHLYTAECLVEKFPGRVFRVVGTLPFSKQGIRSLKAAVRQANITVRNFPLSVAELRKRTKIKEGGGDYLFATTLLDQSKVFILCQKASSLF